jgi:hypothetical protein
MQQPKESLPPRGKAAFMCCACHFAAPSGYQISMHYVTSKACKTKREKMTRPELAASAKLHTKMREEHGWISPTKVKRKPKPGYDGAAVVNFDEIITAANTRKARKPARWNFCPHCGGNIS